MNKIIWSEEFSVGVASLDRQHQRLVGMVNRLVEIDDADVTSEEVSDILDEMLRYAREHFETEEQLLVEHDYPDLPDHREQHLVFIERAGELFEGTMQRKEEVPSELLDFLRLWWSHHILRVDRKYRSFFALKGVQ